ncbi:hypothetical protein ACFL6H_07850 [Candidatus Latescibacterota bacterium]
MPSPLKKSFAAEQLEKKKKKKPPVFFVVVIIAILVVGYVFYTQYGSKEIPTEMVAPLEEIIEKKPTIAVLSLYDSTPKRDNEHNCEGIADAIIMALQNVKSLKIISRNSSFVFKGENRNIRAIGDSLNADYVLEGSLYIDDNNTWRITSQLIQATEDSHIWGQTYDFKKGNLFAVQDSISLAVVDTLKIELLGEEKEAIEKRYTENTEAFDYYLRGNEYRNRSYDEDDFQIALQLYQKAIDLDSTFALAYVMISDVHRFFYWYYYDRNPERLAKSKKAVDTALEINPDLPEAHVELGMYYYHGYLDYDRALEQFAIAQKIQPNNSDLLASIGYVQRRQGKFEQALFNIKKASELDPLSNHLASQVAGTYSFLRNYPETERYYDRAISLAPDIPYYYDSKAWLYIQWEGNTEKARAVLEEAIKNIGTEEISIINTQITLDLYDGNYQKAIERLSNVNKVAEDIDTQSYYLPKTLQYARIYWYKDEKELAQAHCDSARIILESKIQEQPEDARFHSSLGIAYAGLGRKEDAIREGKLGVALLPISKEAMVGISRVEDLARIYVMVGEYDIAIEQLEFLLSRPGDMTVHLLRLDPIWKPLREHQRFQYLLKKFG